MTDKWTVLGVFAICALLLLGGILSYRDVQRRNTYENEVKQLRTDVDELRILLGVKK